MSIDLADWEVPLLIKALLTAPASARATQQDYAALAARLENARSAA